MRKSIRWWLIAIGLLFAFSAGAQSVPGSLRLTWINPTQGCLVGTLPPVCNAPLTGTDALTAINVYISTSPIADDSSMAPTVALPGAPTTTTQTVQVTNGQTLYVRIKAINAAGASVFSNQVSKVVRVPVTPGVPTSVEVQLEIRT